MNPRAAADRLAPYAAPTPLVRAPLLSHDLGCDVFVKNETVSPVASFKWRGALNALLVHRDARGVVTSSTGNHGQGVAWAASTLRVPAHVFLPEKPNSVKRAKIELLGATIHEGGHDLDAAKERAIAFAAREHLLFIDDGESAEVIEGAGTIGVELGGDWDTVYVPMGSGSLAAGIAMAIPGTRVIAVQSEGSPALVESFRARRAVELPVTSTVGDGLVCRVPAQLALDALLAHVSDAVLVSDAELLAAARMMALRAHLLVEPSGAAALAAALRDPNRGRRIVLIATGANITPELFASLHG
jgi:threonine dehydratase